MPQSVPPQEGFNAIDFSANEDNSDKFISANSTDSEYDTTENPFLFSHLNGLIRDLCLLRKRQSFLHQG